MQGDSDDLQLHVDENFDNQLPATFGTCDKKFDVSILSSTPLRNHKALQISEFVPVVSPIVESSGQSTASCGDQETKEMDNIKTLALLQTVKLNLKKENEELKERQKVLIKNFNETKSQVDVLSADNDQLRMAASETVKRTSQLKDILRQKDLNMEKLLLYTEELQSKIDIELNELGAAKEQLNEQKQKTEKAEEALTNEKETVKRLKTRIKNMNDEMDSLKKAKVQHEEACRAAEEKFSSEISTLRKENEELQTEKQSLVKSANNFSKEQVNLIEKVENLNSIISKMKKEAEQNVEMKEEFFKCKQNEKIASAKLRELEGKLNEQMAENKKIRDQYEYCKQKMLKCDCDKVNAEASDSKDNSSSTVVIRKKFKEVEVEAKEKLEQADLLEREKLKEKIVLLNRELSESKTKYVDLKNEKEDLVKSYEYLMAADRSRYVQAVNEKDRMIQLGMEEMDHLKEMYAKVIEGKERLNNLDSLVSVHERSLWDVIPSEVLSIIESLKENYRTLNGVVEAMKTAHAAVVGNAAQSKTMIDKETEVSMFDVDDSDLFFRGISFVSSIIGHSSDVSTSNLSYSFVEKQDKKIIEGDAFDCLESSIKQLYNAVGDKFASAVCHQLLLLLTKAKECHGVSSELINSVESFLDNVIHAVLEVCEVRSNIEGEKAELIKINENLKADNKELQRTVTHLKDAIEQLLESKDGESKTVRDLKEQLLRLKNQLEKMIGRNNDAAKVINEYDEELSAAKEIYSKLCERNTKLENEVLQLKSENESVKRVLKGIEKHLLSKYKEKCDAYEELKEERYKLKKKCEEQKKMLNEAVDVFGLTNKRIEHLIFENTVRQKKIELCYNFFKVAGVEDSKLLSALSRESGQAATKSRAERESEIADVESALEKVCLDVPVCAIENVLEKLKRSESWQLT